MHLRSVVVLDPAGEQTWRTVTPGQIEHVMLRLERTRSRWHPAGDQSRSTDDGVGPH